MERRATFPGPAASCIQLCIYRAFCIKALSRMIMISQAQVLILREALNIWLTACNSHTAMALMLVFELSTSIGNYMSVKGPYLILYLNLN